MHHTVRRSSLLLAICLVSLHFASRGQQALGGQTLFGILYLGNVLFDIDPNDQGEKCVPNSNDDSIQNMKMVCTYLGFKYENIISALCERKMSSGDVSVNQTVLNTTVKN